MQAKPALLLLPFAFLAQACSSPAVEYPSLAIRDAERMMGTMAAPPQPYVPDAPPPAVLADVESLGERARAAHARFTESLPLARRRAQAARRAGVGSPAWSEAQVTIADLETHRGQLMVALADLDRIYVATSNDGEAVAPVQAVRADVARWAEEETAAIAELLGMVGP